MSFPRTVTRIASLGLASLLISIAVSACGGGGGGSTASAASAVSASSASTTIGIGTSGTDAVATTADAGSSVRPVSAGNVIATTAAGVGAVTPGFFGIHFHRLVQTPPVATATAWPSAPTAFSAVRVWDSQTRWADLSPARGQWNFDRLDQYVAIVQSHQAQVLYVLGSTPKWASRRPNEQCPYGYDGCAAGPIDLTLWEDYVRQVVQRYRGKIFAYELWNEPFFSEINATKNPDDFFYGSVVEMVAMARIARKVIDELDPGAVLSTPGFTGDVKFLDLFLSSGGKQYVQAISYHFYSSSSSQLSDTIAAVRDVMHRNGVDLLPLWNSEAGFFAYSGDPAPAPDVLAQARLQSAALMSQSLIVTASAKLDRYFYYAWDNWLSGMVDQNGQVLPASAAMQKTQAWLIGSVLEGCKAFGNQGTVCTGSKYGERFELVWAAQSSTQTLPSPSGWHVVSTERLFDSQAVPVANASEVRVIDAAPMLLRLQIL